MNHFDLSFDSRLARTLDPVGTRADDPDRELTSRFLRTDAIDEWDEDSSGLRWNASDATPGSRLAELRDGCLGLPGLGDRLEARLLQLHRRLAESVVADRPRPIECASLPGADGLVAAVENEWCELRDGFRRDPDVAGWADVLEDRTREFFVEWCFRLLFDLSRGTLHRMEDPRGSRRGLSEIWVSAEPGLLVADLTDSLAGRLPDRHTDPLLAVRKVPA